MIFLQEQLSWLNLEDHSKNVIYASALEEISTQNGPPKENNKIIFINFGGRKEKNYFFCSYFQHISLCFYSNFDQESSLDVELNYASNEYPLSILLTDLATPKIRNTWKKCDDDVIITFFQVFLVFGLAGSIKSMWCGYLLGVELNSASNKLSWLKF